MVARGARRGQGAITERAAERRKSPQNTLLSPHPGLGDLHAQSPRLTPWSTFYRCSAATSAINATFKN